MEDIENKIKESKNVIEKTDLEDGSKIYHAAMKNTIKEEKESNIKNVFNIKLATKLALVVLVACFIFAGGFLISSLINKSNGNIIYKNFNRSKDITINYDQINQNTLPLSFSNFETKEDLINYLTNELNTTTSSGIRYFSDDSVTEFTEDSSISKKSDTEYSDAETYTTNTQVENVDEADIVKVSGNYIFYLSTTGKENKCYMLEEYDDQLKVRQVIEYGIKINVLETNDEYKLIEYSNSVPCDLYVTNQYLIIRSNKYEYTGTTSLSSDSYYVRYVYDYNHTCVFDIYDINTLDFVTSIETAGTNVSTRLIGNTMYVVNNYYDYRLNNNSFYYYPYFFIKESIYYPSLNRIFYCNDAGIKTYVSIYKIELSNEITIEDLHILTPSVNNIYSTEKNIYLLRNYGNKTFKEEDYQVTYSNARVVVVNIEDSLDLVGSFDVKGNVNDKYWIDEKDDYIRVVSTGTLNKEYYFDKQYVYKSESEIFNYLTIFKKENNEFIETGSITEGLGKPGETIRSARFDNNMVTIVTFRKTDPLYYVDISDPLNPIITSALEITGYSIYQHPYKDNYVIGFGYDGSSISSGIKITLFDVSDKENIKQVGNSYIIKNINEQKTNLYGIYYSTPSFYNEPKNLFFDKNTNTFGFCLNKNHYSYIENRNQSGSVYYTYDLSKSSYITEYYILAIDENSDNPIIVNTLATTAESYRIYDGEKYTYYYDNGSYYERLVYINNNYYLLSYNKVDCFKRIGDQFISNYVVELY